MGEKRVSRREVVPSLAVGATAAITAVTAGPSAAALPRRRLNATAGPCGLWPGHSLQMSFFALAADRARPEPSSFRLSLRTEDGTVLVNKDFTLLPGKGVTFTLERRADGTLLFEGEPLGGDQQTQLVVIAIIAVLIGLLLPAVQKVRANATSFVQGRAAGEQNVDYLLPFIEQDN